MVPLTGSIGGVFAMRVPFKVMGWEYKMKGYDLLYHRYLAQSNRMAKAT